MTSSIEHKVLGNQKFRSISDPAGSIQVRTVVGDDVGNVVLRAVWFAVRVPVCNQALRETT
ncbi:hypothetical protein LCGC14_1571390 [marine sediment metagenome]|uniref:Uncharacterized protein n=1 Tax=marine sediment metagenome TaxID=412755 RepID=A0A0F9LJZ9_9ZZZZ